MNESPETTQYDVNLPKPRTRKVLIGVLVAVLVLGTIGVAAAAIANRTAQSQGDATAAVMPPDTMMYFSLNTQADQLPNFNVIADAWKDSKEAKMVVSALEVAFAQSGLNWEDDVQPWLGERIALGMVDFGGMDQTQDKEPSYRTPFFVIAAQTKDRVKSDAALGAVLKQVNQVTGEAPATETYRGIPITYLKSGDTSPQEVCSTGDHQRCDRADGWQRSDEGRHQRRARRAEPGGQRQLQDRDEQLVYSECRCDVPGLQPVHAQLLRHADGRLNQYADVSALRL